MRLWKQTEPDDGEYVETNPLLNGITKVVDFPVGSRWHERSSDIVWEVKSYTPWAMLLTEITPIQNSKIGGVNYGREEEFDMARLYDPGMVPFDVWLRDIY
jgi:hypothetical protein